MRRRLEKSTLEIIGKEVLNLLDTREISWADLKRAKEGRSFPGYAFLIRKHGLEIAERIRGYYRTCLSLHLNYTRDLSCDSACVRIRKRHFDDGLFDLYMEISPIGYKERATLPIQLRPYFEELRKVKRRRAA